MKTVNPDIEMFSTLEKALKAFNKAPKGSALLQSGVTYFVDKAHETERSALLNWPTKYKLLKEKLLGSGVVVDQAEEIRPAKQNMVGRTIDWAGTMEELLDQAYLNHVWVRKTGGVYAGGHPEVDIIGEEEDLERFMEVYNRESQVTRK